MGRNYILDQETANRKLTRMAYEVMENNSDEKRLIIAGIRENGTVIARNIERILKEISRIEIDFVTISLDKKQPDVIDVQPVLEWNNATILLIMMLRTAAGPCSTP